ncbi:hypothetical protein [Natrarchaeobius oligotrophus]|uniref:hypothetical protein n=1 Tax=Natrarchaeobius oligotrophus TaxID=3455743 RepID=UPI0014042D7C|nr:hypothetical protein [Natrarchaeobius chitinivorans]
MATRPPVECPVCHEPMTQGKPLERHLLRDHGKRTLASFVVAEAEAIENEDVAE